MSHRLEQVNQLILREVSALITAEVDFPPEIFVTVTRVQVSKDLRHARVFLSVLPEGKTGTALERVKHSLGLIQHELNQRLSMKPLPRLSLVIDRQEQKANEIEALLDRIKENE